MRSSATFGARVAYEILFPYAILIGDPYTGDPHMIFLSARDGCATRVPPAAILAAAESPRRAALEENDIVERVARKRKSSLLSTYWSEFTLSS